MIRVFAVDDQLPFLRAAAAVIRATDGFGLIGCASSGRSALDRLDEIGGDVDVVLLDIQLGDLDGIAVARQLTERWPELSVIFLSMLDERDLPADLQESGAVGFISKSSFGPESLERFRPTIHLPNGAV